MHLVDPAFLRRLAYRPQYVSKHGSKHGSKDAAQS